MKKFLASIHPKVLAGFLAAVTATTVAGVGEAFGVKIDPATAMGVASICGLVAGWLKKDPAAK